MKKSECFAVFRMFKNEIENAIGPGTPESIGGGFRWVFPYGDGGTVSLYLIAPSARHDGRSYLKPWLACRYHNPAFIDGGYTKPKNQIAWPYPFTYPSGKHNLHVSEGDNHRLHLATHLYRIAGQDTPEKHAFGEITFDTEAA